MENKRISKETDFEEESDGCLEGIDELEAFKSKSKILISPIVDSNSEKEKKDVNRDSHIDSSPISQSYYFFEEVLCLILASSQRKLRGYIEFLKFDVTIKKN